MPAQGDPPATSCTRSTLSRVRPASHRRRGSAAPISRGTAALPAGVWSHLATTWDGSTLRLYVDGVQKASRAFAGPIRVSSGPLKIGGNAVWGEWFSGRIDDVRVYNRGLTAAEIARDRRHTGGWHGSAAAAATRPADGVGDGAGGRRDGVGHDDVGVGDRGGQRGASSACSSSWMARTSAPKTPRRPTRVTWDTTTATNGSHTLTAVARDAAGNTTTSAGVTVTVSNDTTRADGLDDGAGGRGDGVRPTSR